MENRTSTLKRFVRSQTFALILLLIVVVIFFQITSHGIFFNKINLRNVLNSCVVVTFLAIGEGYLIIYGDIDLSVGNVGTACGGLLAVASEMWGCPWYLSLIIAIGTGMISGLICAFLVNELNFQPFIATLAMASIGEGMTLVITNGVYVTLYNKVLCFIGTGKVINNYIPVPVIIAAVFLIVYGIILNKTRFGRSIYLCGGNRTAARLTGINAKKISYILYANSGALCAISGSMLTMRVRSATTAGITENQFDGVTSAILGGISFGGGSGGMFGCFIGLVLLNCFDNGLRLIRVNTYWQTVASGLLLILALVFDYINTKRTKAKLMKAAKA